MTAKKKATQPGAPTSEPPVTPATSVDPPIPAAIPTPPVTPSLTALLAKCFQFDANAESDERQLLFDVFEAWEKEREMFPFSVIASAVTLRALGVDAGVDA